MENNSQTGVTDKKEPTIMELLKHFRSASLSFLHEMEPTVDPDENHVLLVFSSRNNKTVPDTFFCVQKIKRKFIYPR